MYEQQGKPNFLVYVAYLGVYALALNTVYLILPNDHMRWILIGLLVVAVMTGYILTSRHYVALGLMLDTAGLAVFIYYGYHIYNDKLAFGTYLGEMLAVMLVLRCFKLFRIQDFLYPLVISLTLMVFSAIPSFSADFVYCLLGFMLTLGLALFLGNVDEFARLPGRKAKRSQLEYTYDFLEEYAPVPISQKPPKQLMRYFWPAVRATMPTVLLAFFIASGFYFTVDHSATPGADNPILDMFGDTNFNTDPESEEALLTGGSPGMQAQYFTGFDTEFNIARGRLLENSTSTETVMEVESNLPSYWRGKCFDVYTGRGWIQGDDIATSVWSLEHPAGRHTQYHGEIGSDQTNAGIKLDPAIYKDEITQTFYLETSLPGIVFTAWQPVELSLPVPAVVIDDTFTIFPPPSGDSMVAGQSYQVTSRKHFAQGSYLMAYDYDPNEYARNHEEFVDRYTQLPERGSSGVPDSDGEDNFPGYNYSQIRAKAFEITAGMDTVYEKVRALEHWLKSNYKYSLNPPSAVPSEADAVEYFLFDWIHRRGHCEYFSTSLAVLSRSIGIPSRVVTGYTTGNYNLLRNRYVVQERHAHAWVEIFWPEIGWVEFDPTPQTWYQGIGEKAASGWLLFHNAVENLYVYDPVGHIRGKVIPAITNFYSGTRYFVNQRQLDFEEYVDPLLIRNKSGRITYAALLVLAFTILAGLFLLRRLLDPDRNRHEALYLGRSSLRRIKRMLIRYGINPELIATETDCAIQADYISPSWGDNVSKIVDAYETVRYSGRKVTSKHVNAIRRASWSAWRAPQPGR